MTNLPNEKDLLLSFLSEYKYLIETRTGIPFNPRTLAVISQPDLKKPTELHWIAYNKWFDEIDIGGNAGRAQNMIEVFLDIPINILITAEAIGKPLLSKKDQKKLTKALKLISEIKLEPQK